MTVVVGQAEPVERIVGVGRDDASAGRPNLSDGQVDDTGNRNPRHVGREARPRCRIRKNTRVFARVIQKPASDEVQNVAVEAVA